MQTIDVLDHHQEKNGCPHVPHPATLTSLRDQFAAIQDNIHNNTGAPARCHPQRNCDQPVLPNQIGHYGPVWKDCLEEAKVECRAVHALSNLWPKLKMDVNSLTDSLTTVVAQWTQHGICFEPGKSLLKYMLLH